MICIVHHMLFGWSNKKNEIGGAYSAYGGKEERRGAYGGFDGET
jgi:hypothetical protein